MIDVKLVEIRDAATCIPALAIRVANPAHQEPLLGRAGFGPDPLVILVHLESMKCEYDPYSWSGGARTMTYAHEWITNSWDLIGQSDPQARVVDVEFILNERDSPKPAECI